MVSVPHFDDIGQRGVVCFPGVSIFKDAGRLLRDLATKEALDQMQGHIYAERHAAPRQDGAGVDNPCLNGARAWVALREQIQRTRFTVDDLPLGRDEDLHRAHFTGQPVDDHRYGVAGVINEQFVATHVGLAHRNRELALPASVQMCNTFSSSLENCF
jgi:hypothetical protein